VRTAAARGEAVVVNAAAVFLFFCFLVGRRMMLRGCFSYSFGSLLTRHIDDGQPPASAGGML